MTTMYFKGGKGVQNPKDFNDIEIKEGDILTSDSFDPYFDDNFYNKHFPRWSEEDISRRKHTPTYIVKWNEKGFFYGVGIDQELYLHDFRFKFTKIVKQETEEFLKQEIKMESITLKEIAGHLPYVEILITNYKCDYVGIEKAKVNGYYFINNDIYLTYVGGSTGKKLGTDCKLILNNLSMLTQEIEHNGETFVPLEVLGKIYEPNGTFENGDFGWDESTGEDYQDYYYVINKDLTFSIYIGNPNDSCSFPITTESLPYTVIEKFQEWHIDYQDLISRDLAIDKSTLK